MASRLALLLGFTIFLNSYSAGFSEVNDAAQSARVPASIGEKIYCVDARHLGFSQKVLLASLQALANSNAPVLFSIQRDEDQSWRAAMEKQLGKTFETITLDQALALFGTDAPQVIYDSTRRWSLSIATTLAGIHRGLLTDHDLEGHEVAFDCRNQWTSKVEAYRWAVAELLPKCSTNRLVYLDEELPAMRDYAIQQELFVLNLDPLNDPKARLILTRAVKLILWPFWNGEREAGFLGSGFVSAPSQGFQTCSVAKASPEPKNPRS